MQVDWLNIVAKIFEVAIIPIIAAAAMYLVTYIKAHKQQLLENIKSETTKKYIDMLDKTIYECVTATNQTYVEALKKQGTFDAEAHKRAFDLTFEAVMAVLTDEAQKYLNEAIKDLDVYITNKIEAQVAVSKQQPTQ